MSKLTLSGNIFPRVPNTCQTKFPATNEINTLSQNSLSTTLTTIIMGPFHSPVVYNKKFKKKIVFLKRHFYSNSSGNIRKTPKKTTKYAKPNNNTLIHTHQRPLPSSTTALHPSLPITKS